MRTSVHALEASFLHGSSAAATTSPGFVCAAHGRVRFGLGSNSASATAGRGSSGSVRQSQVGGGGKELPHRGEGIPSHLLGCQQVLVIPVWDRVPHPDRPCPAASLGKLEIGFRTHHQVGVAAATLPVPDRGDSREGEPRGRFPESQRCDVRNDRQLNPSVLCPIEYPRVESWGRVCQVSLGLSFYEQVLTAKRVKIWFGQFQRRSIQLGATKKTL